jgi:hypothetical protein
MSATHREELNAVQLILALHKHDRAPAISKLPGLWQRKLNEAWTIWVNGKPNPLRTESGMEVLPGDCYIEFNAWPAGSFNLISGEGIIASGSLANYHSFCDALREAAQ